MVFEPRIIFGVEYLARARFDAFQSRELAPEDNGAGVLCASKAHEQVSLAAARRAAIADHIRLALIGGGLRAWLGNPDGATRYLWVGLPEQLL